LDSSRKGAKQANTPPSEFLAITGEEGMSARRNIERGKDAIFMVYKIFFFFGIDRRSKRYDPKL